LKSIRTGETHLAPLKPFVEPPLEQFRANRAGRFFIQLGGPNIVNRDQLESGRRGDRAGHATLPRGKDRLGNRRRQLLAEEPTALDRNVAGGTGRMMPGHLVEVAAIFLNLRKQLARDVLAGQDDGSQQDRSVIAAMGGKVAGNSTARDTISKPGCQQIPFQDRFQVKHREPLAFQPGVGLRCGLQPVAVTESVGGMLQVLGRNGEGFFGGQIDQ